MMVTLMVTSKGVAAVPRASLVILSGVLTQFGLPLEGIAVILAVDELMDMARTTINLVGNCLATAGMALLIDGRLPIDVFGADELLREVRMEGARGFDGGGIDGDRPGAYFGFSRREKGH